MDIIKDKENLTMSPKVLKPKPLCFRKKPRRLVSSQPLNTLDVNVSSSVTETGFVKKSPAASLNPFRVCTEKRKQNFDAKESSEDTLILCQREKILKPEIQNGYGIPHADIPVSINEDANLGFDNKYFQQSSENSELLIQKVTQLPVDWSLKTKIRLTSEKPFPWRTNFKTSEEASGTTGFVRCLHSENQNGRNCGLDSSYGAKFYQQCLVWIHPSIPWMKLFPRTDNRMLPTHSSQPPFNPYQQEILHSNWCDSFRSLYQLVRTCQCPFFYLCASNFTVMFRAGGVGSMLNIHAAITPTTRGLRNALKEDDIEFTMPLHQEIGQDAVDDDDESALKLESDKNRLNDCVHGADSGVMEEEEEPGMFLESLGLSQEDFPSLNPVRQKLRKESRKTMDHRQESLVYVEGAETQTLVNFLLNYPSCMSKIGPMAGVPPTLLSPVAFLGSSLQAHKIHHNKINSCGKELYAVEMHGPLLPNAIHSFCSLFSSTQDGDFSATLSSHSPTLAFSKLRPQLSSAPSAFATENLKDCGLPTPFIKQMCSNDTSGNGSVCNITANGHFFSWT